MTDKYMREVLLPNVKIGLDRSGRTWNDIDITASGYTVFGENDEEISNGHDGLRQALSFTDQPEPTIVCLSYMTLNILVIGKK